MSAPVSFPASLIVLLLGVRVHNGLLASLVLQLQINTKCSKSLIEEGKTLKGRDGDVSWHL